MYQENKARSYVKFSHSSNEYKEYLINYVLFSVTVHIFTKRYTIWGYLLKWVCMCVWERGKNRGDTNLV